MSFFYSYFFHMRQDKSLFRLGILDEHQKRAQIVSILESVSYFW